MILLFTFLSSFVATYFLTKSKILDVPVHRSSHKNPTPRVGGIALLIGFFVYFLLSLKSFSFDLKTIFTLIALLSVAGVGLIDDVLKGVSYKIRLAVQVFSACLLIASFGPIPFLKETLISFAGELSTFYITSFFTVVLIVFQINALNFCDGFNGQLAGSLLVACLGLHFNDLNPLGMVDALSLSLLGFLCFNVFGKIFLGDVGSTFLGIFFATITLYGAQISSTPVRTWFGLNAILAFLWADVVLTLFKRLLIKARMTDPRRDYLSHILNLKGLRHRHIALIYSGMTLMCAISLIDVIKDDASFWKWVFSFCLIFLSFSGYVYKSALDKNINI